MELLTKMVEHHIWLTGEMVRLAERLTDEQLDEEIELNVDDDRQSIRSLLSRLIGQMGMWNAAMATRDYDWSVEEHESLSSMRERLAAEGPTYLTHVRDVADARPRRRHVRRRAVRARRGLHLRRDDRPRPHLRRPPAHARRARLRQARRRGARLGRPDALGRRTRLTPPIRLRRPAGNLAGTADESGPRRLGHNGRRGDRGPARRPGRVRAGVHGPGRPPRLPGAAAADRGRRRGVVRPGGPGDPPRARGGAARAAAAAAVRRGDPDLARRLQRQPARDPAAVGRPGGVHDPRGRRHRARADPRHLVAGVASPSARSSRRRTPSRRPPSPGGSGCPGGS